MNRIKRAFVVGLAALGIHFAAASDNIQEFLGMGNQLKQFTSTINLDLETSPSPSTSVSPDMTAPIESDMPESTDDVSSNILPTTISGGLTIKNETAYDIDVNAVIAEGCSLRLSTDNPQILIIHTHSSEAYSPAGLDQYEASGTSRTQDESMNIIRIGDELAEIFEENGLNVIHDRGTYDYPSYAGSYNRSGAAIESYLNQYPSISIVIDLHRDALGNNDVTYKTIATESGVCASQVMLLVGTDDAGLYHPSWRQNLSLALYLQNAVTAEYPSLMRPVELVTYRYNQHLTTGSLILEVGSDGNTLQEALAAIRLFGSAAAPALKALVE